MRFALFALVYLLCVFQCVSVNAFTVGKLLPSYICGPTLPDNGLQTTIAQDGLPKSLSDWLKYIGDNVNGNIQIGRMTNRFITGQTGAVIDPAVRVDFATDAGTVNNTKYLLTNWHNRDQFTGCKKTIFVTTSLTNNPNNPNLVNIIVPGQNHSLQLTINGQNGNPLCDFYTAPNMVTADDIANIALDGAVVYGITTAGTRVGSFVALGANAAGDTTVEPWAACGANNIGIVHNQLISETGQYPATATPLIWQAPATLVPNTATAASQVFFQGAAVTDVGFGKHVSVWPVASITQLIQANPTLKLNVAQPVITKVAEMGKNLGVFFNSQAKGAPTANAVVIPTSFLVKATVAGTTVGQVTVKQSPANIPITAAMKGQTVSVTVTASNNNANSVPTTSGTVSIAVKPGNKNNAISLEVVLSLCPADQQIERALYNQDLDSDYQCATQTDLLLQNGTVAFIQETVIANGATHQFPALLLITLFAVGVAALARKL